MNYHLPELSDICVGRLLYTRASNGYLNPKPIRINKGNISGVLNELSNEIKGSPNNRKYALKPLDGNDLSEDGWELSKEENGKEFFIKDKEWTLSIDIETGWTDILYKGYCIISVQPRDIFDLIQIEKMVGIH